MPIFLLREGEGEGEKIPGPFDGQGERNQTTSDMWGVGGVIKINFSVVGENNIILP